MYSMRLIHWKKGKKKKKKNYVYGLNMHVHVLGLMYLFIHLSFILYFTSNSSFVISFSCSSSTTTILAFPLSSLNWRACSSAWKKVQHYSTASCKARISQSFYFYSKWYFSWGKCRQFLTLILSVRLASLPTHTNRTTPVSKMNASPWFMEDQPICV